MKKKDFGRVALITAGVLAGAFAVLHRAGKKNKEKNEAGIDDDNQYLNNSDARKNKQIVQHKPSDYECVWKPIIDKTLSFAGLVTLAPVYGVLSLAIVIDDPGPVLFKQKRVGKNKHFFQLHKFRSMKMSTPHDVPTHMLENPEQYIGRVGRFLRKTSLDELPQIWDIFVGNMSIIGPRPALWNQEDLIEERDKYGANDINPGLTGWAQINGRDELEIHDKAKLDGDYTKKVGKGGLQALIFDIKCFLGTFLSVLREDGVVEGGTGTIHSEYKYEYRDVDKEGIKPEDEYQTGMHREKTAPGLNIIAEKCGTDNRDLSCHHNVLIFGKGSYVGTHIKEHLEKFDYTVTELEARSDAWKNFDFGSYDVVYHVAGIAHMKETDDNAYLYYEVNRNLAYNVAKRAKYVGVKQFIYMSSMSVYGLEESRELITINTPTNPNTNYGKSKLQAEQKLQELEDDNFTVSLLRPPMVYGPGAPGNLGKLFKAVRKAHVFPTLNNERSSISIDNLSEGIKQVIEHGLAGVIILQDSAYRCTSEIIRNEMENEGVKVNFTSAFNPAVKALIGKVDAVTKAFGNLRYKLNNTNKYTGGSDE